MLKPILEADSSLNQKSKNFEMARLTDSLFFAGKVNKELYENLNKYRKKRNEVIHKILRYKDKKQFNKELISAYRLGVDMKVFVVEEMVKMRKGKTSAELSAELERTLGEVIPELHKASKRELAPKFRKLWRDVEKRK